MKKMKSLATLFLLLLGLLFLIEQQFMLMLAPTNSECNSIHYANNVVFFVGVATGKPEYVSQTRQLLTTWGKNVLGRLILTSDNIKPEVNKAFRDEFQQLAIYEVAGAEDVAAYYNKENQTKRNKQIGMSGMRKKMRAMFNIFATKVQIDAGIDWVCLTGSDMYINVPHLEKELGQIMAHPPESCRRPDRCVVTNVLTRHNIRYQGGGFCMRTPTALAVQRFLAIYSDRELDWLGSDDVQFCDMLTRRLGLQWTDSVHMLDSYARLTVTPSKTATSGYSIVKHMSMEPGYLDILPPPLPVLLDMSIIHPKQLTEAVSVVYNSHFSIGQENVTTAWHQYVQKKLGVQQAEDRRRSGVDVEKCLKKNVVTRDGAKSPKRSFVEKYSLSKNDT